MLSLRLEARLPRLFLLSLGNLGRGRVFPSDSRKSFSMVATRICYLLASLQIGVLRARMSASTQVKTC